MDGDLESSDDERTIELSTIAAIFPELILDPLNPFAASLDIPVALANSAPVLFASVGETHTSCAPSTLASVTEPTEEVHYLSHFPSLKLHVTLPEGYPTQNPPLFNLDVEHSWIPHTKVQELRSIGRGLWEDLGHDQVVFSYIDRLQQAAEACFDLIPVPAHETLTFQQELKLPLLDYDLKAKRAKFEQETFDCEVCLEPKKGSSCYRLSRCSHVFCVGCLQDFYGSCITEGDIFSVKCLAADCEGSSKRSSPPDSQPRPKRRRKDDGTLAPSELIQIPIEKELVQRYVKLKRKKLLESDKNTVYCPRQWCQGAARSKKYPKVEGFNQTPESDSESDSSAEIDEPKNEKSTLAADTLPLPRERLAICEDCNFAFCKVCKKSWHGELFSCLPRPRNELTAEERASEQYLLLHTTGCPTCQARVTKQSGCNHMICFRCKTHFCYLCSSFLMPDNPYLHFNTLTLPCYMRLWELEEGDGDNVGHGYAGGAVHRAHAHEVAADHDDGNHNEQNWQNARPGQPAQARQAPQVQAPPNRGPQMPGLQRFLQLVEHDEEDEWDSDELDDDRAGNVPWLMDF